MSSLSLRRFLGEALPSDTPHGASLAVLLDHVAEACARIAAAIRGGAAVARPSAAPGLLNVQGEVQTPLDVLADDIVIRAGVASGQVCGMVSEELADPYTLPAGEPRGRYLLVFDPLDGSSSATANMTVGTIFSVLVAPDGVTEPVAADFLQAGTRQIAAGYALYGSSTMLVLTLGAGVHGFTLDPATGAFQLTHPEMRVPETTAEFAVNMSNARFWELPVRRYVEECVAGRDGTRGRDFNMRWLASMVAEVHRLLLRGGLYMYPRDTRDTSRPGRLRLLYEANPMAMLIEQAGGAASIGRARLLDVPPTSIHQRIPVILGSREEVELLERYHREFESGGDVAFDAPLFRPRSLFRAS